MKLSFSTRGWHNNTFEEFCDIASDLKFEGVELHNINNRMFTTTATDYEAVAALLDMIDEPSFLSLYTGADATEEESAKIEALLRERYCDAEIVVAKGGQPLYDYVISAE